MNTIMLFLYTALLPSYQPCHQSNDTLTSKIIWIKHLKQCLLIGVVASDNPTDTSVFLSPLDNHKNRVKKRKMEVGKDYRFIVEKKIVIASPPRNFSYQYKDSIVWTNNGSYKLMPRPCLNCNGLYVYRH